MGTYNVKLYKNTGFNIVDVPDSPALVDTFAPIDASTCYLKQNAPMTSIKVQKTFDEIKNVDYAKIGDMYYFVSDIKMLNDNVCELSIVEDSITSLGGPKVLKFLDGWCERRSVSSDGLFENVIPETFSPREVLQIEQYHARSYDYSGGFVISTNTYIASTVDLSDANFANADVYAGSDSSGNNYFSIVPSIPSVAHSTKLVMIPDISDHNNDEIIAYTKGYGLFDYSDATIQANVKKLRSLGLETVLIGCYIIPASMITYQSISSGKVMALGTRYSETDTFKRNDFDSQTEPAEDEFLHYQYGTYTPANKKVYAQFNDITVFSIAGDSMTYKASDIYSALNANDRILFTEAANGGPEGNPAMRPTYFERKKVDKYTIYDNAVKGAKWLNCPLVLTGASGSAINEAKFNLANEKALLNYEGASYMSDAKNALDAVGFVAKQSQYAYNIGAALGGAETSKTDFLGDVYGMARGFADYDPYKRDRELQAMRIDIAQQRFAYEVAQNIAAPSVKFAQNVDLQMFFGNFFGCFTLRLSPGDMERFDKYLTAYGYKTSEPLTEACFSGRVNFNFVQASGVSIEKTTSATYAVNDNRMRRINAAKQLNAGVRFWHVKPDNAKRFVNPIAT